MKTAIKNYISEIIPELVIVVLSLFFLKLFYQKLGTEVYALQQLFSQFFAYLVLTEAGFSSASLISLYKPIAKNELDEINKKLSGIKFVFNIIGFIIIILGICVSFFVPFFIKDNNFNNYYIQLTFILYLVSNSINYFFYTYRILYDANQKKYVPNLVYQIGSIFKYGAQLAVLMLGFKFEVLLIVAIVCNLLTNIFMCCYAKKKNSYIKFTKDRDTSMIQGTKDLMVHKISGVIANNIDIIIISKNIGLTVVAKYGAYNYIVNEITRFIGKISTSLYSVIGVSFSKDSSIDDNNRKFIQYNSFLFYIAAVICASLFFAYNSFISLFYGNEMLLNKITVFIFIFLIYFHIVRMTLNTFVNACGLFKETKKCTITEGITNLVLSLVLVDKFGITGILASTIVSYILADFIIKPIVIKNKIKLFSLKSYYQELAKNVLGFIILIILNFKLMDIHVSNFIMWFGISCGIFTLNALISFGYFKLIKRADWFFNILKVFRRKSL